MTGFRFFRCKERDGYTIDQTILIIALIAIMITIVVITVGWMLLRNTAGTKLASQMRQIEQAIGEFYGTYHVWPTQAFVSGPSVHAAHNALLALTNSPDITYIPAIAGEARRNYLPGLRYDSGGVITTYGKIGSGTNTGYGGIQEVTNPVPDRLGKFIVIYWHDVPFGHVQELETLFDGGGTEDYSRGRVTAAPGNGDQWVVGGGTAVLPTAGKETLVNLTFVANGM